MRQLALIGLLSLLGSPLRGEVFLLDTGGRVEGDLLNADSSRPRTYVIRLASGGQIELDARRVKSVERKSAEQLEYEKALSQMRDTIDGHLAMSSLAKQLNLSRQREFHLRQVIRIDPNHERARLLLGYQKTPGGGWATREELLRDDGYVRTKSGWRLPQHLEIEQAEEAAEEKRVTLQKNLRMWRGWLGNKRQGEALENIRSIRDPAAASAVAKMFAEEENDDLRQLLAEVLGRLDSSGAAAVLARGAMEDSDREMRLLCIDQLAKGPRRRQAVTTFLRELNSKNNVRVNRAAVALSRLDDRSAVLPLIEALETTHSFKTGGSPGNMNLSFNNSNRGFGVGNPSRTITRSIENKSVLNALVSLTHQNFQYSKSNWKRWYVIKTSPPNIDLRRDE